jgi:MFS transporter, FHS family, L-fucose permease
MAAPLLASYVFFKNTSDTADGLQQAQWVYLSAACFAVILAVSPHLHSQSYMSNTNIGRFLLPPMPEVTDTNMAVIEHEVGEVDPGSFWKQ